MATPSQKKALKIGDRLRMPDGVVAHIYDFNADLTCAYINWIEQPHHQMKTAGVDIRGPAESWNFTVEPLKN